MAAGCSSANGSQRRQSLASVLLVAPVSSHCVLFHKREKDARVETADLLALPARIVVPDVPTGTVKRAGLQYRCSTWSCGGDFSSDLGTPLGLTGRASSRSAPRSALTDASTIWSSPTGQPAAGPGAVTRPENYVTNCAPTPLSRFRHKRLN